MSTYTNPLAGKAVALIGRFKTFNTEYATNVLEQMGAITQNRVIQTTDIVIVGARPRRTLGKAKKLGIEQWGEAKLTEAFTDYNDYLQQQPNASHFDPLAQTFDYIHSCANDLIGDPIKLYGLPLANQVHEKIIGDHYAYIINMKDSVDIWNYDGLETLQAIIIEGVTDEKWQAFAQQLGRLPNLKALVIKGICSTQSPIDAEQILTALPQLESLFCSSDLFIESGGISFNVARHSNLQQLYINATSVQGLSLVSLPQLRHLLIAENTSNDVIDGMSAGAYPLLNAIHVLDPHDCVALLKRIPALPQISRLKLTGHMWSDNGTPREIVHDPMQIAEWQGIKHITHLDLTHMSHDHLASLKREDFPQLTHLQLGTFRYHTVHEASPITLWEGLHVTLYQGWYKSVPQVESFIETLKMLPPPASLTIGEENHALSPEVCSLFASLPYPVYFG